MLHLSHTNPTEAAYGSAADRIKMTPTKTAAKIREHLSKAT